MPRNARQSLRRALSFSQDGNDVVRTRYTMRRSHTLAGGLETERRVSHGLCDAVELNPSHLHQMLAAQAAISEALLDLEQWQSQSGCRSRSRNGSRYTSGCLPCQTSSCEPNPTTSSRRAAERSHSPDYDTDSYGLSADETTEAANTETDVTDDDEPDAQTALDDQLRGGDLGIPASSSVETLLPPFPFNLELSAEQLDSLIEEVFIALHAASSELAESLSSISAGPSMACCSDILDRVYDTYSRAHLAFQAAKEYDYSATLRDKVVGRLSFLHSIRSRLTNVDHEEINQNESDSPSISAIRIYFEQESARLASKLPSTRPMLDQLAEGISAAVHDAGHFVQEEGEKLVELMTDEAEKLKEALRLGAQRLLTYSELPAAWRNNKHIVGSYRFIPADNPWRLIQSAFLWHNETINIHSHFIPSLAIIWYIFAIFPTTALGNAQDNTLLDRGISLLFLIAALSCLALSAAWHTASGCATWSVFHGCATLDYNGVVALISSSIITLTHQAFRCDPWHNLLYNTITCFFGALGLWLPWRPWFNERKYKNVRIAFFVALAAGGMAPAVHVAAVYGTSEAMDFFSPVVYSLLAYIVGLALYMSDFPERLAPGGLFDTLFHSHQAWHVSIVIAIALHWSAITKMSEKGLTGFSCANSDPYTAQQLFSQLCQWHSEL